MSGEVVGWAMKQHTGSPAAKLVLAKLADNSNEQGLCWPSIELIVEHTELAQSTVYKHLSALEGMGLIKPIEIVVRGTAVKAFQLSVPAQERIPPRGKPKTGIPPDGIGSLQPGKSLPPGGTHIEEPSIEPSENRHSHAEGEKDGSPSAEEGPPSEGPDLKAWTPAIWPAFKALPNQTEGISEDKARARWEAIPWAERPTADELIACVEAYGRDLVRINGARSREKPQWVRYPDNWLKDRMYKAFLDAVRAVAAERSSAVRHRKPSAILPPEALARMRDAGWDTVNIDAYFGGATFDAGPPVRWTVPMVVQRNHLTEGEFGRRMRKAFGDDVVIDVVKQVAS